MECEIAYTSIYTFLFRYAFVSETRIFFDLCWSTNTQMNVYFCKLNTHIWLLPYGAEECDNMNPSMHYAISSPQAISSC